MGAVGEKTLSTFQALRPPFDCPTVIWGSFCMSEQGVTDVTSHGATLSQAQQEGKNEDQARFDGQILKHVDPDYSKWKTSYPFVLYQSL